jgi:uncharacterized protein DUF6894
MPRYFFNIENRHSETDDEGVELAGPGAARGAAVVFAGECLRDTPELVGDGGRLVVEVRDETGAVLLTVTAQAEDPAAR